MPTRCRHPLHACPPRARFVALLPLYGVPPPFSLKLCTLVWCDVVRCGAMPCGALWCGSQEARLERAEGAEVKRQLREALAELESDRSSQARRARNNLQVRADGWYCYVGTAVVVLVLVLVLVLALSGE